jgi:hypothetical protein
VEWVLSKNLKKKKNLRQKIKPEDLNQMGLFGIHRNLYEELALYSIIQLENQRVDLGHVKNFQTEHDFEIGIEVKKNDIASEEREVRF